MVGEMSMTDFIFFRAIPMTLI